MDEDVGRDGSQGMSLGEPPCLSGPVPAPLVHRLTRWLRSCGKRGPYARFPQPQQPRRRRCGPSTKGGHNDRNLTTSRCQSVTENTTHRFSGLRVGREPARDGAPSGSPKPVPHPDGHDRQSQRAFWGARRRQGHGKLSVGFPNALILMGGWCGPRQTTVLGRHETDRQPGRAANRAR